MINKLIQLFKKQKPDLTVTAIIDFSDSCWIVEAMKDPNRTELDPYFYVSKKNMEITPCLPAIILDEFEDAVENRLVYSI